MTGIPDIDDAERWVVESTLRERYGHRVETQLAEVELKLSPADQHLTSCPTLYWEQRGAGFVIAKVADGRYRTMFFYSAEARGEQYGTGRPEFDDLLECVVTVLRLQADHEKDRKGARSGTTGAELQDPGEGDVAPF
jgi:hypothetical protein